MGSGRNMFLVGSNYAWSVGTFPCNTDTLGFLGGRWMYNNISYVTALLGFTLHFCKLDTLYTKAFSWYDCPFYYSFSSSQTQATIGCIITGLNYETLNL